ncbi:MAG TPA: hypothetical protein VNP72_08815, partial [Longimicrobium sp.]|nr:hypothetical protein [Longimicrobium sp.]
MSQVAPYVPAVPRTDPRAFCGAATWPAVRDLVDGRDLTACFLVHDKQKKVTKSGKPYLEL